MVATSECFKALPGIPVKVGDALRSLSDMWNVPPSPGESKAPSEFRASRMNMILHFGFDSGPEEALSVFRSVLDFSSRYPCRVLVLCPMESEEDAHLEMACKIFSECYIGDSRDGMSCCDAITLGYGLDDRKYLEDQVSIFLESDLPTYYWPYRFDSAMRLSDYQRFLKDAERVVFDSSKEGFLFDQVDSPCPENVHDLSFSRLLPLRQCIGQFMTAFSSEKIVDELDYVALTSQFCFKAEGRSLLGWLGRVLEECFGPGNPGREKVTFEQIVVEDSEANPRIVFSYAHDGYFECEMNLETGRATLVAEIGGETHSMTAAIRLLDPAQALAESLFFA